MPIAGDWRAPLQVTPARPGPIGAAATWVAARWKDVEWVTEHAAPYLSRRLHGVSSGDGMVPKRPDLLVLDSMTLGGVTPAGVTPNGASGAPEPESAVPLV